MSDKEKFEAFKRHAVAANEARYGEEIRQKYGDGAVDRANANVLALGARVVGPGLALKIVDTFLENEFEGGRHARRVALLGKIESGNE